MKIIKFVSTVIATLCFASAAHASLLDGKTAGIQYYFPDLSSPYNEAGNGNHVVGPGVEVPNLADNLVSLDISDTNFLFKFSDSTNFNSGTFNGVKITDVYNQIDAFKSVTINGLSNFGGFDASRITFDDNNIWLNFQGLSFDASTILSVDVAGASQVPEPSSVALLALGLLGAAFIRRKNI